MAYVPGYQHDVFVSYAHADDVLDAAGHRWVSRFIELLREALRQRLAGTGDLRVFFDSASLHANHQMEELLAAARGSAIFLAIASRSYAARDWTRRELQAFADASGDTRRLFAVECMPLDPGETYPEPLKGHKRLPFWRSAGPESQAPRAISEGFDPESFHQRIVDLAEQMRGQLMALRRGAGTAEPHTASGQPAATQTSAPPHARTVVLAQVTDDLEAMRDNLRRHLEQFGITVLPQDDYPQGGTEFRAAFEQDLSAGAVFVQLLGPYAGRMPRELPEGYTRFQHEAAKARGLDILQWRHPALDLATVADERHRALLSGEAVMAEGFETFKNEVRAAAVRPPPPDGRQAADALVFLNSVPEDRAIAHALRTELRRHEVQVALPATGGTAEEIRVDLEENLIDCDALVLVYGQAAPVWVRGQLRLFNKLRSRREAPPRVLAVYTGPPMEKPDLDFHVPGLVEINSQGEVVPDHIRVILDRLRPQ